MLGKEKITEVLDLLGQQYPDAECALHHQNVFQLIVAVALSAQTTDKSVNLVTPALFERYPDCRAFAEADQEELESYIRSTGFFRSKARNIIDCCQALLERHNGEVPDTMGELTALAGVGRKTANLVLGDAFGKPSYVVDTHCIRLCNRIGLTNNSDPVKIEKDLRELVPPDKSGRFCHQIVLHGRAYCMARKPKCSECSIRSICRMAKNLPIL